MPGGSDDVDFYDLLEVSEDASQDEVRDAFREKVREYHPDHNDDPRASAQFTALKKAYDTLGDPVERNAYDRMGHEDYVYKRLDGLPDADAWHSAVEDADGSSSGTSTTGSSSTGSTSTSSTGRSSTSGRRSTGSSGSGSTNRTSTSTGTSSSSGSSTRSSGYRTGRNGSSSNTSNRTSTSTGGSSRNRTSSGTTRSSSSSGGSSSRSSSTGTSTGSSGQRTASDGAGATATGHAAYEVDPVVEWIAAHPRIRAVVGWELLWVVLAVYALGVAAFARLHQDAALALFDRIVAAGADAEALSAALERDGVPVVAQAVVEPLVAGTAGTLGLASGALLVAGAVLLPAATALLVHVTRTTPGWKPTWGYVLATLAPLAGIVAGLATTPPLAAELGLFVALPVGALFVMVLSAFVRPRVLIFLHNVRS